jgi:hypothetical protein
VKSILATSLTVLAMLFAPLALAQSSGETSTDEVDMAPPAPDAPAVVEEVPVLPQPTVVAVQAPDVHATIAKMKGSVELLPSPNRVLPRLSEYDWSSGPISQIPSPVGAPLFNGFQRPIGESSAMQYQLAPAEIVTYSYTCQSGQCMGSAEDVWNATPIAQREAFLTQIVMAEHDNQSWEPRSFVAAVAIAVPAAGADPIRGCARMTAAELKVRFAPSCVGPFTDHLPS